MAVNLGINIQRSPNRINQQLREAGVGGKYPKLLLDFADNYYLASGGSKTLANAVTHARAGNATMTDGYGPELVTNGGFDSGSDWTLTGTASISGGKGRINSPSGELAEIYQNGVLEIGKTYVLEYTLDDTSGDTQFVNGGTFILEDGKNSLSFIATTANVYFKRGAGSVISTIDNVSVREMPVIKWAPHNLLTYSEDLGNWTNFNTTDSLNQIAAPDGTTTADKLVEDSSSAVHNIYQTGIIVVSGVDYTFCTFVKQGEYKWLQLSFALSNSTFTVNDFANFDVNAGTVGTTGSGATATIEDVGNGWYKCSVTATAAASASSGATICLTDNTDASSRNPSYAGDGSSGIYVWGMHFNRADLGGMVDNPERGDSYVPTALRLTGPELATSTTQSGAITSSSTPWFSAEGTGQWSVSSNSVSRASGGTWESIRRVFGMQTNKAYVISFDVTGRTTGSVSIYKDFSTVFLTASENGSYTGFFVPVNPTNGDKIQFGSANFDGTIENITIRESSVRPDTARYLPRIGHHVYNGSAWVNEGLFAESEARTNLITDSFDFSAWANVGTTVTPDDAVSPEGTESADAIFETTATSEHYRQKSVTSLTGTYTFSVYLKAAGSTQYVILGERSTTAAQASFDLTNGTVENTTQATATIQNIGNGWYRCSLTPNASLSNQSFGSRIQPDNNGVIDANNYAGNTSNGVYAYGAQLEQASTPSSFIPTSGSSVTRAAETFTIPSANLPWPEPQYIGSELVTNGTFNTDISDWEVASNSSTIAHDTGGDGGRIAVTTTGSAGNGRAAQNMGQLTTGKVYRVSVDFDRGTANSTYVRITQDSAGGSNVKQVEGSGTSGTIEFNFVPASTADFYVVLVGGNTAGHVAYFDNVTFREINPLSVSIAMDGRMTYADTDTATEARYVQWQIDSNNNINLGLTTFTGRTGQLDFSQKVGGTLDKVQTSTTFYSPDVLIPYDFCTRHGSTFVNGAVDGVALTANTTPTALVDLSAEDMELVPTYMGTVGTFRVWDRDITDTGLVEATNPSLEPSLSLTFEGVGTNSFVVNDWSE